MLTLITQITVLALLGSGLAAPANITKRYTGKAGIGYPIQEKSAAPVPQFFGSGSAVTWWFDWNKNYLTSLFPGDTSQVVVNGQFIPMEYDPTFLNNADTLQSGWTEIMGYNEPDLVSSTGVSTYVPPATAANSWKTLMTTLRAQNANAVFYSPAVAGDKNWLVQFFAAICPNGVTNNCEWAPDYLAIHVYSTDVNDFKNQVSSYWSQFGLPIVVSEFACYSWDGSNPQVTADQASSFMAQVVPWLDDQSWVHKYAWFGAVRNSAYLYSVAEGNRLLDANGALTALGTQYMAGGVA